MLVYFPRPTAVNEDAKKAMTGKTVDFDQKKCVFEPHVLGLMVGETVTLKSSDPVNHNVNVKLKAVDLQSDDRPARSQQNYPAYRSRTHPGPGRLRYSPLDESLVDGAGQSVYRRHRRKGNFEIKNVPAGARRSSSGRNRQRRRFRDRTSGEEVTIKADDTTVKEFKIDSSKLLPPS